MANDHRVCAVNVSAPSRRDTDIVTVITTQYVLKKNAGRPPSLVVHLHTGHFRFDGQDGVFSYRSPMAIFVEHLRARTIPHDILEYLIQADVPFYDGCLIVQVHDHKSIAQTKDARVPKSSSAVGSSIHKYTPYLTPSPFAPFPKDEQVSNDGKAAEGENKGDQQGDKDKENMPAPGQQPFHRLKLVRL